MAATDDDLRRGWGVIFFGCFVDPWSLFLSASLAERVVYRPGEQAILHELEEQVVGLSAVLEGYHAWLAEQGEELAARNVTIARRALG